MFLPIHTKTQFTFSVLIFSWEKAGQSKNMRCNCFKYLKYKQLTRGADLPIMGAPEVDPNHGVFWETNSHGCIYVSFQRYGPVLGDIYPPLGEIIVIALLWMVKKTVKCLTKIFKEGIFPICFHFCVHFK